MDSRGKSSSARHQLVALFTLPLLLLLQLAPVSVDSYPIFGTKRYHRNNGQQLPQFNPQQQQPLYAQQLADPMDGYYSDDPSNYFYYAPHDPKYHSYGMPVFRGDYTPPSYMYAQGPTYQYYDDKEASNPLDDLHEEMLEEDAERERAEQEHKQQQQMRQFLHHRQQPQQLSNDDDYADLVKQGAYYQPIYEPGQQHQKGVDYGDDDENVDLMDSNYAQANAAFLNDLIQMQASRQISGKNRNNAQQGGGHRASGVAPDARNRNVQSSRRDHNTNWNFDYPSGAAYEQQQQQPLDDEYDYDAAPYSMESTPKSNGRKSDDKAVRELQALTHSRDKTSSTSSAYPSSSGLYNVDPMSHPHQSSSTTFEDDYFYLGGSPSSLDKASELTGQSHNYEYEDGGDEWINWDSKRSAGKPLSIISFTDRKPSKVVRVPETHFVLGSESTITSSSTSDPKQAEKATQTAAHAMTSKSGQKEEVLMRPAPPVRNSFSAPVMKMLEQQEQLKTNKYENHAAVEDLENKKRSAQPKEMNSSSERKPKATVYDTIKHLLDMEQQLKEQAARKSSSSTSSSSSRIQKRFVSNEGSLVRQLESLKRMQV